MPRSRPISTYGGSPRGGNPEDWWVKRRSREEVGHFVEGEVTGLLNAALVNDARTAVERSVVARSLGGFSEEEKLSVMLRAYLDRAKAPASLAKFLEGKYGVPTREDFKLLNAMPLPAFEVAKALGGSTENDNHSGGNGVNVTSKREIKKNVRARD